MLLVWLLECSIDSKLECTLLLPRRQHKQDMSCEILRDYCRAFYKLQIAYELNMQDHLHLAIRRYIRGTIPLNILNIGWMRN